MSDQKNIAQHVHDDLWDLFGSLTREASIALLAYFQELQQRGILTEPRVGSTSDRTLEQWKVSEVKKILENDGFDVVKKLAAIDATVYSDVKLDGSMASTEVAAPDPAPAQTEPAA